METLRHKIKDPDLIKFNVDLDAVDYTQIFEKLSQEQQDYLADRIVAEIRGENTYEGTLS